AGLKRLPTPCTALFQVSFKKSRHFGIRVEAILELGQAVAFIGVAKKFHRYFAFAEGRDNLLGLANRHPRVVGSMNYHHGALNFVHVMNGTYFLEKRPVLS